MDQKPPVRKRRETGWWEPTYNPALVGQMADGVWAFANDRGPLRKIFLGEHLKSVIDDGGPRLVSEIDFKFCDFQGHFTADTQITFDHCDFINCDLALTTWIDVKFSNCKFFQTSFGMTTFKGCEFRDCEWKDLGLSSNETKIVSTLINNSAKMIASAYTNLDPKVLGEKNARRINQICKLETTKATVARQILKSFEKAGDEKSYYEAVKTFELQQAKGRVFEAVRVATDKKSKLLARFTKVLSCPFWAIEWAFLFIIGIISGWGASVTRPLILSTIVMFIFGKFYEYYPIGVASQSPFQKSLEISLLAGYTNYHSEANSIVIMAQLIQLALSCLLYSLTFAAILSRFSRVR